MQAYLLKNNTFPGTKSAFMKSGVTESILWIAPCAKAFKQDSQLAPGSKFTFPSGGVDPAVFEALEPLSVPTTIVVSAQKVDREFLQAWRYATPPDARLTLIRRGTSMGSIDIEAARSLGIAVRNTPGVNSPHVAKFVFDTLRLTEAVKAGTPCRAVLVGAGSVGRAVADLMASVGVRPTIIEHLSAEDRALPDAARQELLETRFGIPRDSATLGTTLDDALPGATHVAFCCPTDGTPLMDEANVKRLLSGGDAARAIRIACIARPDAFSVAAIKALPANVHCQFDYGETVLAPVRKQVDADGVKENIGWSSKAMNSEACKEAMDEAVLRLLNPTIPWALRLSSEPAAQPAAGTESRLGVVGGPSCWVRAFLHLTEGEAESSVAFFRPTRGHTVRSLWRSSGRQISVREKVTKFIRPASAVTNIEFTTDMAAPLASMGATFASERFVSDDEHLRLKADVEASLCNYRKINAFLATVGEKPIWRETGRLVIAGAVEKDALYEKVLAWRRANGMVDEEQSAAAASFLKDFAGVLFNDGYTGYPLRLGGYVVRDAEDVLLRGLKTKFGPRLNVVDSTVNRIVAVGENDSNGFYRVATTDTKETEVGKLFVSPGATHLVRDGEGDTFERVARPIEITGHSGVVAQSIDAGRAEKLRAAAGGLEEFFASKPAAFMTDDFELTFEGLAPGDNGGATIRWRVTGGARINSARNTADPSKTLLAPVCRFLAGDVRSEGFHECPRQVGPSIREQYVPFGQNGVLAMNWGHLGVSLAGLEPPSKL